MADFALFLRANFNQGNGLFLDNAPVRQPDNRFWDEVVTGGGGVITPQNKRINADTRTVEMEARTQSSDRVYFAVNFTTGIKPNKIAFMCGLHQSMKTSRSTTASPFRHPDGDQNGEIQCDLESGTYKPITVNGKVFHAIGPYTLVRDPQADRRDCCFYKLTVVANATDQGKTREFAYDPDMDVETGL
jgi:hypothetical protein